MLLSLLPPFSVLPIPCEVEQSADGEKQDSRLRPKQECHLTALAPTALVHLGEKRESCDLCTAVLYCAARSGSFRTLCNRSPHSPCPCAVRCGAGNSGYVLCRGLPTRSALPCAVRCCGVNSGYVLCRIKVVGTVVCYVSISLPTRSALPCALGCGAGNSGYCLMPRQGLCCAMASIGLKLSLRCPVH